MRRWRGGDGAEKNDENENIALTSGDMGLLTGPHHISCSEPSSFTMRLSDGDRPVFAPE